MPKTDEKKKETNKPSGGKGKGYIAGTNLPVTQSRNSKNSEFAILDRRKRVAEMYMAGSGQWEIARTIGIERETVFLDLGYIRKAWLEKMVGDFDSRKAEELAKIDHIERRMWESYDRSCGEDQVTRTKEKYTSAEGNEAYKNVVTKRKTPGNTKYIEKIQWCIELRCKIFGIIKDEKRESVNNNIVQIQWDQVVGKSGADDINAFLKQLEELPDAPLDVKPTIDAETI